MTKLRATSSKTL